MTWHYRVVQNWSTYSHLHFPLPTSLSATSTHHLTTLFASSRFSSYTNHILPTHNHAHQFLPIFKRLLLRHFLHSTNVIPSRITIFFSPPSWRTHYALATAKVCKSEFRHLPEWNHTKESTTYERTANSYTTHILDSFKNVKIATMTSHCS